MIDDAATEFVDPYLYPGTRVLKNLLNEHDQDDLNDVEYALTFQRRIELADDPPELPFSFKRLLETHRRLFQDLYSWAGQIRTVDISKGSSMFIPTSHIATGANSTFEWLNASSLLTPSIDDEMFVAEAGELLERINYIHPFREGNGRAQRAFLDQIAETSGRTLAWRNVGEVEQRRAAIDAHNQGSGEPWHPILRQALRPPIDGLSPLAPAAYVSSPPVEAHETPWEAAQRWHADYSPNPGRTASGPSSTINYGPK